MGRKNFVLQYTGPGGDQSSATPYSLIETAIEIGLDLYCYLLWVLERSQKIVANSR